MSALDALLDTSLDDIEDLPEYADYVPTGHYTLQIKEAKFDIAEVDDPKDKSKKIDADVFRVSYEIVAVNELSKEDEANLVQARDGDKPGMYFSESFWFHKDAKKSLAIVKAKYKAVIEKFELTDIRKLVEVMPGLEIASLVSSKASSKDKEKFFINTKNIQVL